MTDQQLLDQFVRDGDQNAFADLVRRHVDWVCSMATRLSGGNRAMAEDATQATFILLGQKAHSLRRESSISNWLFVVTRYCVSNALRNERTRRHHEQEAAAMRNEVDAEHASQWDEISPMLDELVGKLRNSDRQAVLLRYYQRKTFPEVGQALRISEEAARKRVSRALENLRNGFARRGIAVGAAALATAMSANLIQPASAAVIAGATTATATTTSTSSMIKAAAAMLTWASLKPVLMTIVGAAGLVIVSTALLQQSSPAQNSAAAPTSAPSTAPAMTGIMRYGRLLDEDDKPLAGVRVWAQRLGTSAGPDRLETAAMALTDADGRFAFPSAGSTTGVTTYAYVFIDAGNGRAFTGGPVYSPIAANPTEFRARPSASVRVSFIDPAGKPAAGLRVILAGLGESRNGWRDNLVSELDQSYIQTTDADGACTFTSIPRNGMAWFNVLDDRYAQVGFSKWITLNSEPFFNAEPFQLEPGASISGKVTFADTGKPAAGIKLMGNAARGPGSNVITDDQGRYQMKQLHPGTYCVFAFLTDEMSQKVSAVAIENIDLQAGMNVENQDLSLVAGGIVRGKVTEAGTGKPLKGVGVNIDGPSRPSSTHTIQEVTTNADGEYLMHIPPGQQNVYVLRLPPGLNDSDRPSRKVTIADGQAVEVNFSLKANLASAIKGRTVDPQKRALAGVEVYVERRDNDPAGGYVQAISDADGFFSIPVVDSSSQVRGRRGNWSTLEPLAPDGKDLTLVLHPNALASLRVVVNAPDGTPIQGAMINLNAVPRAWIDGRPTGLDGSYTFKRLDPDMRYSVRITADGFGASEVSVPIKAGQQTDLPPIVLPKADSFISGIVQDENGKPLANMRVSAVINGYATGSVSTDASGRFRIDKLVAGENLRVFANDETTRRGGSVNNVVPGSDNVVITIKSQQ